MNHGRNVTFEENNKTITQERAREEDLASDQIQENNDLTAKLT